MQNHRSATMATGHLFHKGIRYTLPAAGEK